MKLKEFINQLENIKNELKDTEIYIISRSGLMVSPELKFSLRDYSLDKTKKNVEFIVIK